jgi:chromosome segregation ATPase
MKENSSEDLTKKLPQGDDKLTLILQNIDSRLQRLEQKVEERLHDTRPIWERVVLEIAQLREGQQEIKTSIRDIFRRLSIFNDTLMTLQADYRDIYDRVRGLERNQNPSNSST